MNRTHFLKKAAGLGLAPVAGWPGSTEEDEAARIRQELAEAWRQSEVMTLKIIEQMPPEAFGFRYTPGAMSFGEQFRHCVIFTSNQLAGRLGVTSPLKGRKLPVELPKADVLAEVRGLYAFVQETIRTLPTEKLFAKTDFPTPIPNWRLLYAMENHLIHHRGQAVVYLRLKGITPEGYFGW